MLQVKSRVVGSSPLCVMTDNLKVRKPGLIAVNFGVMKGVTVTASQWLERCSFGLMKGVTATVSQ